MINTVTLGSIQLNSETRILTSVKNLSFPFIQYSATRKTGFAGQSVSPSNFASYKFAFEFTIGAGNFSDLATAREQFTADISQALSQTDQTLYISKSNGIDLQIELRGTDIQADLDSRETISSVYRIEFEAEYPFLQSQTEKSTIVGVFDGGGMAIPMDIPMDMSSGGTNEATITNDGNADAYPVFTFKGALTNPSLTNFTTGLTLNINQTLASASNQIVVDTFLRTVVINPGSTNGRQYSTGDFWTLIPGDNLVRLGSALDGGTCTVFYRDHYLGL